MNFKKKIIFGFVLLVVIVAVVLLAPRVQRWLSVREAEQLIERELPAVKIPEPIANPSTDTLPDSVNLPVPFTPQAPHANWDLPYQEACEEASALMAIRYFFGNPILDKADADAGIKDLVNANENILGLGVDQTAAQVRDLILEIDPTIPVSLINNPTIDGLKLQLFQGNVIIVPVAGRKLKNPFFQPPGPLYHMFVLRGYTNDGYFIVNEPGTKRGEGYLYTVELVMEAMGDWNDGDPSNGDKVVLMIEALGE